MGQKKINFIKLKLFFVRIALLYNKYLVDPKKLFPKNYHYRANLTRDVLDGMNNLVQDSEKILNGIKNKKILDIGCNDGSLLNFFKKRSDNSRYRTN